MINEAMLQWRIVKERATFNDLEMEEFSNQAYLNMELLRFTTAGSVDDGKSTLIGRLLYDSKSIFEDQIEAVKNYSQRKGHSNIDLALFTDGLRSEREQGITIDVAYRYFATPKRKFIIADTPGHVQYTRNMVTGASTANAAIVLVDARLKITEQTRRHCYIASLLKIPHLLICINKMDLVEYSQATFIEIVENFKSISNHFNFGSIHFLPISALNGDNVVKKSENMPWYNGATLLHLLETLDIETGIDYVNGRFPVQYVIRPQSKQWHDYRGYAGRVDGGTFRKGDSVLVLPSGVHTTIASVDGDFGEIDEAFPPKSVTIQLTDDIDISRGDMIVKGDNEPTVSQNIVAMICWMNPQPLRLNGMYALRHTTREVRAKIMQIDFKVDMDNLANNPEVTTVAMNDIARITLRTSRPLIFDTYETNRKTGSFILIEEGTNETVGVGMII